MTNFIGLDIGGTKIAGGVLSPDGVMLAQHVVPTPKDYMAFLQACHDVVRQLETHTAALCTVGIGIPGWIDQTAGSVHAANLPWLRDKSFRDDLSAKMGRDIRLTNDANAATLAEAIDGAGKGFDTVFGLVLGTGVGSGFVAHGRLMEGTNGLAGEIGHLPLPFREAEDGTLTLCGCGQNGCIEQSICGGALSRLYEGMTSRTADAALVAEHARAKDADALRVLDRYYDIVAKAMVTVIHSFDPALIVVSGGLNTLPALYDEVPKRWGKYTFMPNPKTRFVPAQHGTTSGIRGAAWLWKA